MQNKQRNKYYYKKDSTIGKNKFDYEADQHPQSNQYMKQYASHLNKRNQSSSCYENKNKKQNNYFNKTSLQQQNKYLSKANKQKMEQKINQNVFKNIEKCTEKMEYYKLMGSLEQQKRTILQQQNILLKQQNQQIKHQIHIIKGENQRLHKQNNKLVKKLKRAQMQEPTKNQKLFSKQKQSLFIQIPERLKTPLNQGNKAKQKASSLQNQVCSKGCQKCIQLYEKLNQQRQLYQKDRKYLKDQIDNLNQIIDENKSQVKRQNNTLQNKNNFYQQRQLQLLQQFSQIQKSLKQQLSSCYKKLQDKYNLINDMEMKLDFFESENKRILKMLTLLDKQNIGNDNNFKQKQNYYHARQARTKSSNFNSKAKQFNHEDYLANKNLLSQKYCQNNKSNQNNENKGKTRKFGSIKKIQSNQ